MQNFKSVINKINKLEKDISEYKEEKFKEKTLEFKSLVKSNEDLEKILPEAFALAREATKRITGKRLYDVQLIGGYILNKAEIAEIKAGEGKTLTAVLRRIFK